MEMLNLGQPRFPFLEMPPYEGEPGSDGPVVTPDTIRNQEDAEIKLMLRPFQNEHQHEGLPTATPLDTGEALAVLRTRQNPNPEPNKMEDVRLIIEAVSKNEILGGRLLQRLNHRAGIRVETEENEQRKIQINRLGMIRWLKGYE